jgi:hypothetical protein
MIDSEERELQAGIIEIFNQFDPIIKPRNPGAVQEYLQLVFDEHNALAQA